MAGFLEPALSDRRGIKGVREIMVDKETIE